MNLKFSIYQLRFTSHG